MGEVGPSLLLAGAGLLAYGFFAGTEVAFAVLPRQVRERLADGARLSNAVYGFLSKRPRDVSESARIGQQLGLFAMGLALARLLLRIWPMVPDVAFALGAALAAVPLVLLLGQAVPRGLALRTAEGWVRWFSLPMALVVLAASPLRLAGTGASRLVLWATGRRATIRPRREELLDEEEFRSLIDASSKEGEIRPTERALIHKVLEFSDLSVASIMTPAADMFMLSYELPLARLVEEVAKSQFQRVPIYRGRRDEVVGVLLAKDLVAAARGGDRPPKLQSLLFPPFFAPKTTKCDKLFQQMQRRRTGLALVVDEYGRTCGLVTMGDLLKVLFGDLARHTQPPATSELMQLPDELQRSDEHEGPREVGPS